MSGKSRASTDVEGAPSSARAEHWADRVAREVVEAGRPAVISTGISPSGEIHIGNMREVLTGDAIYRALGEMGQPARFNYVADNFDPLRKVYPFLDEKSFAPCVGRPLSEIRCPCEKHDSYATHYLEPFIEALRRLRIEVEVERADQMYKSGRMSPFITRALQRRDTIARILLDLTGKEVAAEWSPFNPLCPQCGRIDAARVTGFSETGQSVDYACACGSGGTVPMAGGGKLVWRVDWPARWMLLGVTVEPFGKDHATRGGSYDSGVRIIREVFEGEPPFPIPYEWIRLKGQGDMSSSRGNVLSIGRVLEVVPPEVLRYLVIRERPLKTINFSPGLPLLQLVDQVDDARAKGRDERALELSTAGKFDPVGVPFKHLVVVAQIAGFETDQAVEVLARNGYPRVSRQAVARRMGYARRWLEGFAPDEVRFTVQPGLPDAARELDRDQARFLERLASGLAEGMDGDAVHRRIYDLAASFDGVAPSHLFQAIYLALLGKPRGPRAGWFIALLGPEFSAERFREAAGGKT